MVPSNALLSLILIASTANAISVSRRTGKAALNFSTRINAPGALNIAEVDRARVQAMKQGGRLGESGASGIDVTNNIFSYIAQVGIGSPPTEYTLLIDTGSANTWVGAGKAYVNTTTSRDTGYYVSVSYGSGVFYGTEWNDTVTLNPSLVIDQQSIGVASSASGVPPGIDGLLGVGPVDLTQGSVSGMDTVPTVLDNLRSQGTIWEEVLGVYYVPYAESGGNNGKLTFGGYDPSATITPVVYVPLTKSYPASLFWGIEQSISYGSETILSSTAGIVDTGTTLTLIATDAFQKYQTMTGATIDKATSLLSITPDKYSKLQPLFFNVGDVPFVLTPNAQTWPRSLNTVIGGSVNAIYLVVGDIGHESGSGFDFINGYTFLERFHSVYDTTNQRVGFAFTDYTFSQSN